MSGISFNIWAILILLGAVQGLVLSVYLFIKRENRCANKWLAFLLLVVSLHLLEYAADITGITFQYPVLLAITYPLLFCMGPFYYFYCRHLLDSRYKVTLKSSLHFLPALAVLLLMMPFYTMPSDTKISFMQGLSKNDDLTIPTGQLVFMAAHVIQTIIYIFVSYKMTGTREEKLKNFSSDAFMVKKLDWFHVFSLYFSIYFLLYFILVVLLVFVHAYQVQIDYIMLLITSVSVYAIGYSAISHPEIFRSIPDTALELFEQSSSDLQTASRSSHTFPGLKEKLLQCMETNKPYLKSDLRISELADSLGVPYYQLSQLINDEFLVNFYDLINKYRVEEAKKLLIEDDRNYKILVIAYETGFNSKATFNRVFKKFTGLTPSAFKEKYSIQPGDTAPLQA